MKKHHPLRNLILAVVGVAVFILAIVYVVFMPRGVVHAPAANISPDAALLDDTNQQGDASTTQYPLPTVAPVSSGAPTISFVGPRENIPKDAPAAYGFWSFAVPVNGVISRSGQPLLSEFQWLKDNGWKGDVDLRMDGEYNDPAADDSKLAGFNALGFNYLHLNILDGHAPTTDQANQFLAFVTNPVNQPVHVHCRGGYGRAGTMIALYRYAVQGWPIDQAIAESRAFHGGISDAQKKWLTTWAATNQPGSYTSAVK